MSGFDDPDLDQVVRQVRISADIFAGFVSHNFEVDLMSDADSVRWVSDHIDTVRETIDSYRKKQFISVIGSWLGEAIIASYGGLWLLEDDHLVVEVQGGDGFKAFPFREVSRQFAEGSADGASILRYFTLIETLRDPT